MPNTRNNPHIPPQPPPAASSDRRQHGPAIRLQRWEGRRADASEQLGRNVLPGEQGQGVEILSIIITPAAGIEDLYENLHCHIMRLNRG